MVAHALMPSAAAAEPVTNELHAALAALLANARAGDGGVLVLERGRADEAADLADGFRILRTTAVEAESELAYAGLADVLRPVLHLLRTIPEPQADALRAAFALGTPSGADALALCAGTLSLLSAAGPVLVAIDDAQWLDAPSAQALQYAFRRLGGTKVAAVISVPGEAPATVAPIAVDEPRRLLADAAAARAEGRPDRALRLLDDAFASTDDPLVRADVQHLRGLISMWRAAPARASRQLLTEAARVEAIDPGKAAGMVADAAFASFMAGDLAAGIDAAERASALGVRAGGTVEVLTTGLLGVGKLVRGEAREAVPLLDRFAPLLDDVAFLERGSSAAWPAALALVWLERYDEARDAFSVLVDFARGHRAPALLPHALIGLSELDFRTGDWHAAEAAAGEAADIAEQTGQPVAHALALLALARVAAPQGREEDCTAHVFEAVRITPSGAGAVLAYAGTHLGALELALGRAEATVTHLEQVAERSAGGGIEDPGVLQWAPDLIEAYARCGRSDDARDALEVFERRARAAGRPWGLAAASRCRGLLASTSSFESAFLDARAHGETPFDRARTELCFGERLRRARRRVDARVPLRAALAIFEQLGAASWAGRARSELRATGEAVRGADGARPEVLTPQELEIARLVAGGATNREAAAALYLSPKTIETHLGHVYRKLGVRSRTELARTLA